VASVPLKSLRRLFGRFEIVSSRVSCAVRLNSARTAAAIASAALGRKPSADMAGTAEAASGTATASVRLKAQSSFRGIFGIVSSASDRAAAEGKIDQFTRK
jgi:hypothetical protein